MDSGKFHKAEEAFQGDDEERFQQPERDDDEEDEFIEVSILDGLSIEELPPPTTLFREEGDELIEVSIFGNPPEREQPPPTTLDEEVNVRRKVKEEESVSHPVEPNPPQIDNQEAEDEPPSFSFKVKIKKEEEDEEPQRAGSDDDGGEIEVSIFGDPHEYVSPIKVEREEERKNINSFLIPPPPTATRDEEFEEKVLVNDSEYFPPPKEDDSESDEDEARNRRKVTRKKRKKRKKQKPRWISSQFPTEKDEEGDYYCADCDRGNDIQSCRNCKRNCWRWCEGEKCEGYFSSWHECFKSLPRKQRTSWNSDLFPSEKNTAGDYFCADCDRGNDIRDCRNCGRDCWRWCDGEECKEEEGYKEVSRHKCFKSKKKRKRRLGWKREDFPEKKEGKTYCGDCQSSNEKSKCLECGRWCWKWCKKCGEYRSRQHVPCTRKKKRKRKRKREEKTEKEFEKLEPSKKKRKLE